MMTNTMVFLITILQRFMVLLDSYRKLMTGNDGGDRWGMTRIKGPWLDMNVALHFMDLPHTIFFNAIMFHINFPILMCALNKVSY